jgi:2-polyprenyl-3-methyl-5-hydroxy-6-metoxy-1,4-benzoquinol methylase
MMNNLMDTDNNKSVSYYSHIRLELLELIPEINKGRVLSLGCGYGNTEEVLMNGGNEVWAIESNQHASIEAKRKLSFVIWGDVDEVSDRCPDDYFDCIILSDILEHLFNPLKTLKAYRNKLRQGGVAVASLPNVRNISVTFPLVLYGRWQYKDEGILDNTHLRFFTKKSIKGLFADAGFDNVLIKYRIRHSDSKFNKCLSYMQKIVYLIPVVRDIVVKQYIVLASIRTH